MARRHNRLTPLVSTFPCCSSVEATTAGPGPGPAARNPFGLPASAKIVKLVALSTLADWPIPHVLVANLSGRAGGAD